MTVELSPLRFSVQHFTFYTSPYLNTSGLDKPLIRGVKKSACAISFSLQ